MTFYVKFFIGIKRIISIGKTAVFSSETKILTNLSSTRCRLMSGAKTSSKSSQVETIAKRDNMEIASSDLSSPDTVKNLISYFPMKLNNLTNDTFTDFLRFEYRKLLR
jgi:hypothetical protein